MRKIDTDKCTKISPDDTDLRHTFLNHFTKFVYKKSALKKGILAINFDV